MLSPSADTAIGIVFAGQAELNQRLQNQAIRQQQVVVDFDARRAVAGWTTYRLASIFEPLRRQPMDADGQPRMRGAGPDVLRRMPANTSHQRANARP